MMTDKTTRTSNENTLSHRHSLDPFRDKLELLIRELKHAVFLRGLSLGCSIVECHPSRSQLSEIRQ